MKSLLTFFRLSPVWGAVLLLLSLLSPASAGHWEAPTYIWSGKAYHEDLFYNRAPTENVLYSIAIHPKERKMRDTPATFGDGLPNWAEATWLTEGGMGIPNAKTKTFVSGPQPAAANATSSVYAVLKWKRDVTDDFGEPIENINDNPPAFVYVHEKVSLYGERSTTVKNGGTLPAYDLTPWPGDFITLTGKAGSRDLQVSLSGNWQYSKQSSEGNTTYGHSLVKDDIKVRRYPVSGDTVTLPSVSFSGSAQLSSNYQSPQVGHYCAGSVGFTYNVTPLDFNIHALSPRIFRFNSVHPDRKDIDAWAQLNWKSADLEKPFVPFWDGGASYYAYASLGSPDTFGPKFYKWDATPAPHVSPWLPDDPATNDLYTIEGSRGDKEFHFDLANDDSQLPKSTSVKVHIGKAEGLPPTITSPVLGPASVTIHWHSPLEGIIDADGENTFTMLPGNMVAMATVRDDAGAPQTPAPKPIENVQVGDKITVPGHPLRRVVTSREILPNGSICLHLSVDADDNPLDPAFDLNEQSERINDARLDAQHTGARGVKLGLEAYKGLAEFYAYGPLYELGGVALTTFGSKGLELVGKAVQQESLALRLRQLASGVRSVQKDEKAAKQLESQAKDLETLAQESRAVGSNATTNFQNLESANAKLAQAKGEVAAGEDLRLVVGGGNAEGFPASQAGDVSLNWHLDALPTVKGDIKYAPFKAGTFKKVFFENVPDTSIFAHRWKSLEESARVLAPGGELEVRTGAAMFEELIEMKQKLTSLGFSNIQVTYIRSPGGTLTGITVTALK